MSITPSYPPSSDAAPLEALAFCSVGGRQGGQIFPLASNKTVLQFDSTDTPTNSQPTRCLVVQGKNGVSIRTIQGRMSVNNQVRKDAWLKVNDEISCGNARLRLIRRCDEQLGQPIAEVRAYAGDPVYHIEKPIAEARKNSETNTANQLSETDHKTVPPEAEKSNDQAQQIFAQPQEPVRPTHQGNESSNAPDANQASAKFFGPFPWQPSGSEKKEDSSTLCLLPGELKGLLSPMVYESNESPYVVSPCEKSTATDKSADSAKAPPVTTPLPQTSVDSDQNTWRGPELPSCAPAFGLTKGEIASSTSCAAPSSSVPCPDLFVEAASAAPLERLPAEPVPQQINFTSRFDHSDPTPVILENCTCTIGSVVFDVGCHVSITCPEQSSPATSPSEVCGVIVH